MITYYDICFAGFRAFEDLADSPSYLEEWMSNQVDVPKPKKSLWERIKMLLSNNKDFMEQIKFEMPAITE